MEKFFLVVLLGLFSGICSAKSSFDDNEIKRLDYKNDPLTIIAFEGSTADAFKNVGRKFSSLTGSKVQIVETSFGELFPISARRLADRSADIAIIPANQIPEIIENLQAMPDNMKDSFFYENLIPPLDKFGEWQGKKFGINMDGDRVYLTYRADLFEDKNLRSLYKKKTGQDLNPPQSWKHVTDLAKFFHKLKFKGKTLAGFCEIANTQLFSYETFLQRAYSYAYHPHVKGGMLFDLKTMKTVINTPPYIEALKDMIAVSKYYPPNGGMEYFIVEVANGFGKDGTCAMATNYDNSLQTSQLPNGIRGLARSLTLPGSMKRWNRMTHSWEKLDKVQKINYLPTGFVAIVAKSAPKSAFSFLGFFNNKENYEFNLLNYPAINPYLKSSMNISFWTDKVQFHKKTAQSYVKMLKEAKNQKNLASHLSILRSSEYGKELMVAMKRAMKGQMTAEDALNLVAIKWDKLTQKIGIDKQRIAYQSMVTIEDTNK